ncbi:hypothetical protein CU254_41970 (plasmid) [Amycolatopsis sp. AA4]|uniref:hypothetical protein n=1 Tax=Actinomycetes TaxID=1760 RepID=UPI0001B56C1D|nr:MULTISPECIES: hypothetical protein [Actinomycetes]ATY17147.1 hypothetical protein CU254_41970 [Amycolatopsis sp. AA4]EFL12623.1 predicted protein [Streptomyces sp. AA4]
MTTVAAPAVTVRFDEHPGEWRTVYHLHNVDELVEQIVTGPPADAAPHVRGHREIHLGARPYDPLHPEMAPMMLVAAARVVGAVYYREIDAAGHPIGYIARGDGRTDTPGLPFSAQGALRFKARRRDEPRPAPPGRPGLPHRRPPTGHRRLARIRMGPVAQRCVLARR